MYCSVFIATSADGMLARKDGGVEWLHSTGNADVDGGTTIQGFLRLNLINEITITRVPILLGEGVPLFGSIEQDIKLVESKATAFPNDFVQVRYKVSY